MRRTMKRKATAIRKANDARRAFIAEFSACMVCGATHKKLSCHEICRGRGIREKSIHEPCTYLVLCWDCHNEMDDYSKWPIARQYALKKLRDPENYNRVKCNIIRGRAENAITEKEVEEWTERQLVDKMNEPAGCYQHRMPALTNPANKEQGNG